MITSNYYGNIPTSFLTHAAPPPSPTFPQSSAEIKTNVQIYFFPSSVYNPPESDSEPEPGAGARPGAGDAKIEEPGATATAPVHYIIKSGTVHLQKTYI